MNGKSIEKQLVQQDRPSLVSEDIRQRFGETASKLVLSGSDNTIDKNNEKQFVQQDRPNLLSDGSGQRAKESTTKLILFGSDSMYDKTTEKQLVQQGKPNLLSDGSGQGPRETALKLVLSESDNIYDKTTEKQFIQQNRAILLSDNLKLVRSNNTINAAEQIHEQQSGAFDSTMQTATDDDQEASFLSDADGIVTPEKSISAHNQDQQSFLESPSLYKDRWKLEGARPKKERTRLGQRSSP